MPQVVLDLDDELILGVLEQAKAADLDFQTFLLTTLRQALSMGPSEPAAKSADKWLQEAVKRATGIKSGSEFKLQDLFDKDEWKSIPSPTVFGRNFRKEVEESKLAVHVGKTPMNQAIYRRL